MRQPLDFKAFLIVLSLSAACGPSEDASSSVAAVEALEPVDFESLAQMVATSDAVVLGRVIDSREGPAVPAIGGGPTVSFTEDEVQIESVLHGDLERSPQQTFLLQQLSSERSINGWTGIEKGQQAVMFVRRLCDPDETPLYYLMNTQSAFVLDESNGEVLDTQREDELTFQVEEKSSSQLLTDLAAAVRLVGQGQVEPAEVVPFSQPGDYKAEAPTSGPGCEPEPS